MNRDRRFKSILEEIGGTTDVDKSVFVENRAKHLIASSRNIINYINENFDEDMANDLVKRLINSIKTGDDRKFVRGIRKGKENDHK